MNLQDLKLDPILSTEILDYLGIHPDEIHDNRRFTKLQEVVKFFTNVENRRFVINKLMNGKPGIDKLDHVWQYVTLRKEHANKQHEMIDMKATLKEHETKQNEINKLEQELTIFET